MKNSRLSVLAGWMSVLMVIAVYNAFFFNRYFPLTEGWFSMSADLILQGKTPYKDFFLFLPPLYSYQLAAVVAVFGHKLIVLRLLGVGLILLMSSAVYLMYCRWFPAFAASFATILCMMYYQSGVAHITYDFTQAIMAYGFIASYFVVRFAEEPAGRMDRRAAAWLLLGGACCSFAFLTKQSNGGFISAFALLAVGLVSLRGGVVYALKSTALFGAGIAAPILLTVLWLAGCGALAQALDQVYFSAVQSKGGWGAILFSWCKRFFNRVYAVQLGYILSWVAPLLFLNAAVVRFGRPLRRETLYGGRLNVSLSLLAAGACAGVVLLSFFRPALSRWTVAVPGASLPQYVIVASTAMVAAVFLGQLGLWALRRDRFSPGMFSLSVIVLGMIWGNGASAGIGEISCCLGLGLATAALLSLRGDLFLGKAAVIALGLSYAAFLSLSKFDRPYAWWGLEIKEARGRVQFTGIPELAGFRLSEQEARTILGVTEAIRRSSSPEDGIFCFPYIPCFYLFAHRRPATPAFLHWFDVFSDGQAADEAERILRSPPQVIVAMEIPEFVWASHEGLFRGGRRMGQRLILEAIETLVRDRYLLEAAFDVPNGHAMKVWRRKPGFTPSRGASHEEK